MRFAVRRQRMAHAYPPLIGAAGVRAHHRWNRRSNNTSVACTASAERLSLPPNSPNYCFLSLSSLLHYCDECNEASALDFAYFASLFVHSDQRLPEHLLLAESLDGILRELQAHVAAYKAPEMNCALWALAFCPPFLGYCCLAMYCLPHVQQHRNVTLVAAIATLNQHPLLLRHGIIASFVNLAHFQGISFEILPYLATAAPNPHFYGAAHSLTEAEVTLCILTAREARGYNINEEEYQHAVAAVSEAHAENSQANYSTDTYFPPFYLILPSDYVSNASTIVTAIAPTTNTLLNLHIPRGSPGDTLLVTCPTESSGGLPQITSAHISSNNNHVQQIPQAEPIATSPKPSQSTTSYLTTTGICHPLPARPYLLLHC